jgi:hypothetical protein
VSNAGTNFSITSVRACQSMETESLKRLALKWMNHYPGCPAMNKFVYDNDNYARYLLTEVHWSLSKFVDPNHAQKCILSSGPKVHAPVRSDEDAQNFYR